MAWYVIVSFFMLVVLLVIGLPVALVFLTSLDKGTQPFVVCDG